MFYMIDTNEWEPWFGGRKQEQVNICEECSCLVPAKLMMKHKKYHTDMKETNLWL